MSFAEIDHARAAGAVSEDAANARLLWFSVETARAGIWVDPRAPRFSKASPSAYNRWLFDHAPAWIYLRAPHSAIGLLVWIIVAGIAALLILSRLGT